MAFIHRTTLVPSKLELLSSWLPTRPWYIGTGHEPDLAKAGGFRLDDPQGSVGIEFMVVTDGSGDHPRSYHVPLSYRGAPFDGAERGLIGTSEHGELGRRWVYDGAHDPVLVAELLALLQARAEPQAQSVSDTPDPSVISRFTGTGVPAVLASTSVTDGRNGTDIRVAATPLPGAPDEPQPLTIEVTRVLRADQGASRADTPDALGHVTAGWNSPDGDENRGLFAVLRGAAG